MSKIVMQFIRRRRISVICLRFGQVHTSQVHRAGAAGMARQGTGNFQPSLIP
jgi:hypothetical protein